MGGYLLDTNVLSELLKKRPERSVIRSLNVVAARDLYTSSICVMELRRGACLHPQCDALWHRICNQLLPRVQILPFDEDEAVLAGDISAALTTAGTPIGTEDAQIAATALRRGLSLSTRNAAHFGRVRALRVVNWWV